MKQMKSLVIPFGIAFFVLVMMPTIFPWVRFICFAPFLTLCFARLDFPVAIWIAAGCGLICDLSSFSTLLGLTSLNYILSTLVIYRYRKHFLEEKIHVFTLYSILFSFVSTLIHFALFTPFASHIHLHPYTILSDLLVLPLFDGALGLLTLFYPLYLYRYCNHPKRILFFQLTWARFYRYLRKFIKTIRLSHGIR